MVQGMVLAFVVFFLWLGLAIEFSLSCCHHSSIDENVCWTFLIGCCQQNSIEHFWQFVEQSKTWLNFDEVRCLLVDPYAYSSSFLSFCFSFPKFQKKSVPVFRLKFKVLKSCWRVTSKLKNEKRKKKASPKHQEEDERTSKSRKKGASSIIIHYLYTVCVS